MMCFDDAEKSQHFLLKTPAFPDLGVMGLFQQELQEVPHVLSGFGMLDSISNPPPMGV